MTPITLSIALASVLTIAGVSSASTILVQDNFNSLTEGTGLNGRTNFTNNTGISGLTWTTRTSGTPMVGAEGGALSVFAQLQTSGLRLDDYIANNPGIYRLSMDITHATGASGDGWVGFGFARGRDTLGINTGENLTHGDNQGGPWMFYRASGEVNIRRNSGNNAVPSLTGYTAGTLHNFAIEIDTTPTQWTMRFLIDGVAQDLNGVSVAGDAYTYGSGANPTLRHLTISSSGNGVTPTVDNFTFELIPEPGSMALGGIAGLLLLGRRRR